MSRLLALAFLAGCSPRSTVPAASDAHVRAPAPPPAGSLADAGAVAPTADEATMPATPAAEGPIPAAGAFLVGERLIVLEPDLLALRAVDLGTRRTAWRTAFREEAAGAATLERLDGSVYVHAGNTIALVDVASGAIRARRTGRWNEIEHRAGLWRAQRLCAIRTECEMELVDCGDLRTIGAPLEGRIVRRYPLVNGHLTTFHHTGCWGWLPFLLGRAGTLAIATTDRRPTDPPASPSSTAGRSITVALDSATGREAWSSEPVTCSSCDERVSGISPDGRTCWLGEVEGTVRVFDCATGRLRYLAGLPPAVEPRGRTQYDGVTAWTPRGLVVSVPPRATLHDAATGRALWSRPVPRRTLLVPLGGLVRDEVLAPDHPRTLLLVDPETGRERARETIPANARLLAADGGLRIEGTTRAWDAHGTPRAVPAPAPLAFDVERRPDRTIVRPTGARTALLDEPVDGESLGELELNGRPCVVVRLVPSDRMGEIRVVCR